MPRSVVVSACLVGRPCRYDGRSRACREVQAVVERIRADGGRVVEVCPEEEAGLGTPRPAIELRGGDGHAVLDGAARVRRLATDEDVTDQLIRGAQLADRLTGNVDLALLKARSPSCGVGDTHIDGAVRGGDGVFAALLQRRGVRVHTEADLP